jgi:nucleoside-diphosphate-sugar epimerase
MTVLVFGASGAIGRFLLPRLRDAGVEVLAISRATRASVDGVHWRQGALPDRVPALPPVTAIVSLGPLLPFAQWLERTSPRDAPRVIAIGSMSADSKLESPMADERATAHALREGEAVLARACAAMGSAWTMLRPTLIYGAGMDRSLTPIARRACRWRVFPLPAGRGLRQPVHADDIARAVIAAIDRPQADGRVFAIGGGERLSAAAMFARVRRSLPVATLPLPLPAWLLRVAASATPRLRGPLQRLDSDLLADNGELERLLGVHPRPFHPDAQCWQPPAHV